MSVKLRELIREVRQTKSASAERAVIAKELANIRTAIKRQDQVQYRHRNVAKLMYCDMLGYPCHFGQMEVLKLLASKSFVEKRLGYLALMQLLDENTEVLMLSTQSLKQDMCHENPFIVGLSLCAMGNIASADISRDLGRELEKLLKHNNPYIRKKALCTAIRVINRVPEMCDEYFKCGMATLEDSGQGHGPAVAAVQLLYSICMKRSKLSKKLKKYSPQIIGRLSSLLRASYDPDHDIGGVTDPFLQVYLLKLLRLASFGDKKLSEDVDSVLAQIATNTESNKNPGNSILYECVRTIMSIEKQSSLHVLAINILGRFLVNRDNNVRYVALNALCNVVSSNTDAIQRHRNTIVECLKDEDLTIRKRALDLIYALTNTKNIRSLARDLLNFLTVSNTTASEAFDLTSTAAAVDADSSSPSKHDDAAKLSKKELKKLSKKERKKYEKEQRAREERERQHQQREAAEREREQQKQQRAASASPGGGGDDHKPVFIEASSLSTGELEFRQELASIICMVVEQYAPDRKWHIDTIIQVMATTTATGFNREQEVICNLFILVSNSPSLQAYCTYKLFECISKLQLASDPIRQFTAWLIGEYGDKLMDDAECQEANDELMKDRNGDGDDDEANGQKELLSPHVEIEQMTKNLGPFEAKSPDEIISMLKYIAKHDKSSESTKGYALTALMKLRHRYELNDVDRDDKIDKIVEQFQDDKQLEVQQRSVEYLAMYANTDSTARNRILKPMPVPPIERLLQPKSEEKTRDDEDELGGDIESDSEPEEKTKADGDDSEDDDSDDDEDSDDDDEEESDDDEEDSDSSDSDSQKKKGKKSKKAKAKEKKEKEKKKKEKEKQKEKGSKKKKGGKKGGSDAPSIPVLLGPDEPVFPAAAADAAPITSNGPPQPVAVAAAVDLNNHNHLNNGNGNKVDDLLSFGLTSIPTNTANVPPPSNNGGGGDLLADIMGGFGGSNNNAAAVPSNNLNADPLSDILGVATPSSSQAASGSQSPTAAAAANSQPFEAYNSNGITATFNFVPAQQEGVCRVLGVFHNSNSFDVSDFSFMIATPKYLKIQLKPANGTQLLALSQNSVTQRFQLTNTLYGSKPFTIRIQVVYTANGQQVKDRSQVQFPDNCC